MIAGAGKVIQLRLIVGGSARMPDFASELIAGYKDGWSHVDTIVPAGVAWPEGWLIGARSDRLGRDPSNYAGLIPSGMQVRPPGYTTFRRCGIITIPVTDRQRQDFWLVHLGKIGMKYDWRSIIAFALPFGTRDLHSTTETICSEAVEDSLEKAAILSQFWLAPYKISPGMLAARVEVLPGAWFTEIRQGTDPRAEPAIALKDWSSHCRGAPSAG